MRLVPTAAIIVLVCASGAHSQQGSPSPTMATTPESQAPVATGLPVVSGHSGGAAAALVTEQMEGDLLASDLVGKALFDPAGGKVGEVADVLIDRSRRLRAVVVTLDAGLGTPGKKVGIAFETLQQAGARREARLVTTVDVAVLKAAKSFEPLAKEAGMDDNQDLTTGSSPATGGSVPPTR